MKDEKKIYDQRVALLRKSFSKSINAEVEYLQDKVTDYTICVIVSASLTTSLIDQCLSAAKFLDTGV